MRVRQAPPKVVTTRKVARLRKALDHTFKRATPGTTKVVTTRKVARLRKALDHTFQPAKNKGKRTMDNFENEGSLEPIAIIGMVGRFPGAKNINQFWQNLCDGVMSISFFSDEEAAAAGVEPALLRDPNYVKARGVLEGVEMFDASFFGFTPMEAQVMDPQHRLFLECAWEALESAGYIMPSAQHSERHEDRIGVYAGAGMNMYLLRNLLPNRDQLNVVSNYQLLINNDKDHLATRVSYKLNLQGPSVNVNTACSTSLVAVQMAVMSLLNYQCDMALAGGVSIYNPQKEGYLYQEGMIFSPDGHCRAFDARSQGTVGGSGVGIVVLKRLEDALADGDYIYALIKGAAINNDGSLKVGYTAPSVEGQAAVILDAHAMAEVSPETISYIEAHGTATPLGDPIEIAALTNALGASTDKKWCAIGSVKTNVGHLDTAAGVTGLIKTALALKHQKIPPSLHFCEPNPQIDFANSPFYVNTTLSKWDKEARHAKAPRRAGVSSFGVGGTNAHVVLEEAPPRAPSAPSRPWQLLLLSAKTLSALENATTNLAEYLTSPSVKHSPTALHINLADVAHTLQVGRRTFSHRRMLVCRDLHDAVSALKNSKFYTRIQGSVADSTSPVVFMFSGQGAQYVNMARELYDVEPTFRAEVDRCSEILKPHLGLDLRHILYPSPERADEASQQLKQTALTQPALFVTEYALAQLWISWGVRPQACIGHSIGEYVAACLAGVFSLEDALSLVAARGQLMQNLPKGGMLAVSLSADQLRPLLGKTLSLAVINGPSQCVVSGHTQAVDAFEQELRSQGINCRRLQTSHAFHSEMMTPILPLFTERVKALSLSSPQIPYLSNVTGSWITAAEATEASYWAKHLRQTVHFSEGLETLLQAPNRLLLEVGPGQTLATLARRHPDKAPEQVVLSSLRHPQQEQSDVAFLLTTLGQLWLAGVEIDWAGFYADEQRYRLPLPTYPFERQRHWIDAPPRQKRVEKPTIIEHIEHTEHTQEDKGSQSWLYQPHWTTSPPLSDVQVEPTSKQWLLFEDSRGVSQPLQQWLKQHGHTVTTVQVGTTFDKQKANAYYINPQQPADYEALVEALQEQEKFPSQIVHCWSITHDVPNSVFSRTDLASQKGFLSLLYLTQALSKSNISSELVVTVISNQMQAVKETDWVQPEKALVLGAMKTIEQEIDNIQCRSLDIELPFDNENQAEPIWLDLLSPINESVIAYRQGQRWTQSYQRLPWEPSLPTERLRQQGVYLITGGLGGIGLTLAQYLAKTVQAKLILVGRTVFPEKEAWQDCLASHDESEKVASKIRLLQALEQNGAEVLVYSADVADIGQMQQVIEATRQDFGPINGVIHAAGGALIANQDKETSMQVLAPKVTGTLVLEQLLAESQLDFFVLCSSLASITGTGITGQIAYCAANAFQDAFAQAHRHSQTLFTAINWDTWQKVGMAADAARHLLAVGRVVVQGESASHPTSRQPDMTVEQALSHGLLPKEGVAVFEQVLQHNEPQVIATKTSLMSRFQQIKKLFDTPVTTSTSLVSAKSERPALAQPYVAPRTALEEKLAEIWQAFMGITPIGVEDDFFELGGDSLLAVQLMPRLRESWPHAFSIHTLLNFPTIAALAQLIEEEASMPEQSNQAVQQKLPFSLVEIQKGNQLNPPLFLMHPVGGHVYFYRDLAHHLGADQPVYGLQAQSLDRESKPLTKVEDMANHYLKALRVLQPEGPYFLAGSSFGGTLAFEMAQQLHTQGQKVGLLAMIDTPGVGHWPKELKYDAEIQISMIELRVHMTVSLDDLRQLTPDEQLTYLNEHIKITNSDIDLTQFHHLLHLFKLNSQAMVNYRPNAYPGRILFFRAKERDATNPQNPEYAWIDLAKEGIEIIGVPGNHITMNRTPHVHFLAERLRMRLKKAQANEGEV